MITISQIKFCSKTDTVSKEEMYNKEASPQKWTVTLLQVLDTPNYKWIQYFIFGAVITFIAVLWKTT